MVTVPVIGFTVPSALSLPLLPLPIPPPSQYHLPPNTAAHFKSQIGFSKVFPPNTVVSEYRQFFASPKNCGIGRDDCRSVISFTVPSVWCQYSWMFWDGSWRRWGVTPPAQSPLSHPPGAASTLSFLNVNTIYKFYYILFKSMLASLTHSSRSC